MINSMKINELKNQQDINIEVTLIRSLIGVKPVHKKTAVALGLRKIGMKRNHKLNKAIYGMLKTIEHMVTINKIN